MRRAIIQVFTGNVTSKFLGIGREVLTAALFGTGPVIGAFRVAQTGTLVPVNFFTSDVLNAAFIPQYRKLQTISWDKSQVLLWSLLSMFVTLAMLIGLALWVSATPWITALAPGLETDAASQAAMMLQIMAVGVPPYLLGALLIFVGMANDDFVPMAIRPALQNLGLIIGALTAFVLHDVRFLAGGFTASYMVFCVWVLVRTFRSGLLYWPGTWDWPLVDEVMRAFWRTLRPLLLMPFMLQGNIVVERAVASVIGLAAISALDYARFITETLIILISVPVAYAGLTHWSGLSVNVIRQRLHKVLLLMLVVAVPLFMLGARSMWRLCT
jgi:putative peptidoglycan lipid II flippase